MIKSILVLLLTLSSSVVKADTFGSACKPIESAIAPQAQHTLNFNYADQMSLESQYSKDCITPFAKVVQLNNQNYYHQGLGYMGFFSQNAPTDILITPLSDQAAIEMNGKALCGIKNWSAQTTVSLKSKLSSAYFDPTENCIAANTFIGDRLPFYRPQSCAGGGRIEFNFYNGASGGTSPSVETTVVRCAKGCGICNSDYLDFDRPGHEGEVVWPAHP